MARRRAEEVWGSARAEVVGSGRWVGEGEGKRRKVETCGAVRVVFDLGEEISRMDDVSGVGLYAESVGWSIGRFGREVECSLVAYTWIIRVVVQA